MTRIGGLDCSRNWAILCVLETFPEVSLLKLFQDLKTVPNWKNRESGKINECMYRLEADGKALEIIRGLQLDAIILEPTGVWYSRIWVEIAIALGIEVYWVSHQQVKHSRKHFRLKNKDDRSDALTIAALYFDPSSRDELGNPPFIKNYNFHLIDRLRTVFYEREQLDKLDNSLTNQLRQRLCVEWPEIAERNISKPGKLGFNPTLGHLAGRCVNPRLPKESIGIGISPYSRALAGKILDAKAEVFEKERELASALAAVEFQPYKKVLDSFGFGIVLQSLLMIHIYPLERFFLNGKPYIKNGHDLSLRKFQAYLGLGFTYEKSGSTSTEDEKVKRKWLGSEIVRSHLYAHALVTICRKTYPGKSPIMLKMKKAWFEERVDERSGDKFPSFKSLGKDGICRLLFYETRLLYQELKRVLY